MSFHYFVLVCFLRVFVLGLVVGSGGCDGGARVSVVLGAIALVLVVVCCC